MDKDKTCGSETAMTVWNIIFYSGHYTTLPLCNNFDINKPIDCSKYGGYDSSDLCMQTCLYETEIEDEEICTKRCVNHGQTYIKSG